MACGEMVMEVTGTQALAGMKCQSVAASPM